MHILVSGVVFRSLRTLRADCALTGSALPVVSGVSVTRHANLTLA